MPAKYIAPVDGSDEGKGLFIGPRPPPPRYKYVPNSDLFKNPMFLEALSQSSSGIGSIEDLRNRGAEIDDPDYDIHPDDPDYKVEPDPAPESFTRSIVTPTRDGVNIDYLYAKKMPYNRRAMAVVQASQHMMDMQGAAPTLDEIEAVVAPLVTRLTPEDDTPQKVREIANRFMKYFKARDTDYE